MQKRIVQIAAAAAGVALVLGGTVVAVAATGGDSTGSTGDPSHESETPIPDDVLEQASAAALAATGGGTVTGTEVGDEESLYEVEVTLADGSQVDVQLDASFDVVSSLSDIESAQ